MSETKKQILEIQIYIQYQIDKHLLLRVGLLKVEETDQVWKRKWNLRVFEDF